MPMPHVAFNGVAYAVWALYIVDFNFNAICLHAKCCMGCPHPYGYDVYIRILYFFYYKIGPLSLVRMVMDTEPDHLPLV